MMSNLLKPLSGYMRFKFETSRSCGSIKSPFSHCVLLYPHGSALHQVALCLPGLLWVLVRCYVLDFDEGNFTHNCNNWGYGNLTFFLISCLLRQATHSIDGNDGRRQKQTKKSLLCLLHGCHRDYVVGCFVI